jgi:DNA (cytosine-5)-methyltransferase 1
MMTFIDLFAGVGGFRRGLELAGHKCVGFCEFDKFAVASYTSMHLITEEQRRRLAEMPLKQRQKEILKDEYRNGEWYAPDIRSVRADDVPRADCWCFGSPCQNFSIAGKREGLDGDRSSLVREVFRIIRETREENRPEWLVYENVKGMLSSNRGWDYAAILVEMDELGYDCEWQIFNSKYHDVPQNRERVYTVGHLRTRGRKQVFPLCGADEEDSVCGVKQIGQRNRPGRDNLNQYRVYDGEGIAPCLNKMDGGGREPHTAVCIPVLTPDRAEKRQNGRRFKDNGEEAFTLTAQDRHGVAISEVKGIPVVWYEKYKCYIAIRKLTPKECFRLQGWTDDYFEKAQFVNSDSQLYKQAGNGVTVTVVEDIGKRLKEV